jgi:hypothetical protein
MVFKPQHCGLYFTQAHIESVQKQQTSDFYAPFWALLQQQTKLAPLDNALWNGFRYRFLQSENAGAEAMESLKGLAFTSPGLAYLEQVSLMLALAQCYELLRDHVAWGQDGQAWLVNFRQQAEALNSQQGLDYVEAVWLNTLNLVAAVVLEDEAVFTQAVSVFEGIISADIHPEGYIPKAITSPQGPHHEDGESLLRMVLTCQALILSAEVGTHAGADLWAFNRRGVSVLTPLPYLLYYYYFPEKWRWEKDAIQDYDDVQAMYQRRAGFWEIAQHQAYSRDRATLLDELRPVFDVFGGGFTSLSHGTSARKKRFGGLFG